MRSLVTRRGRAMLAGAVTLPSMICCILVMFVILLAFDIISIQVDTRLVGPTGNAEGSSGKVRTISTDSFHKSDPVDSSASVESEEAKKGNEMAKRKKSLSVDLHDGSWGTLKQLNLSAVQPSEAIAANAEQLYAFKMLPINSMGYEDVPLCPGLRKQDLKPIDERYKFLFILGAQKAGTTWLHSALERHPIFIQADRGYMWGWSKEVRFFNTLPLGSSQEYLDLFPEKKRRRAMYNVPTVFLDSTPNNLFTPSAAPRVKQMIPHAKFIIVLRDPVARTVSSHNMFSNDANRCWGKACSRQPGTLLEEFRAHSSLNFNWPGDLSGCNFNTVAENPSERRTWGDCWRCEHFVYACKMLSHLEAQALGGCAHNRIPHVPTMPLTHYGLYAAQIAWWMAFFPPDRFLILTREELRDPKRVVPALNKVLNHVGYPKARNFTENLIGKVNGFTGKYTGDMSDSDQLALKEISAFFEQPNKDLQTLMDRYFPDAGFKGFTPEYTTEKAPSLLAWATGSKRVTVKRQGL